MRISDWSSDVCSSDLVLPSRLPSDSALRCSSVTCRAGGAISGLLRPPTAVAGSATPHSRLDRKSVVEGTSESVRVYLGGRRYIKKKQITITDYHKHHPILDHSQLNKISTRIY